MREFFDNIPLDNQEISEEQLQKIKASVLSRVKEEKAMSKKSTIRMVTIAVAAAATAALSAMIASAEQPAWTPATDVDYTVDEAAETEVLEVTVNNEIDEAKANETVYGWVDIVPEDLVYMQPADDPNAYYIYYKVSDEQLEEMINNGWTLIDADINTIHKNEVFVTE